ncbi:MAG TPA: polyprenol monophosphomannose synthase [candidate division Zixibacteria bacterium]|nr:polyprenol monophosphomannose synthase [candidate division Zixibacteria bacterium]
MERVLVIMPTYNERDNIARIIPAVLEQDPRINMLIIDDNSPDGTGEIVDKIAAENPRVDVIHREGKLGLGTAYVRGFKYSLQKGYDLTFEMDADFSHDPAYLPKMIAAAEEGYDLVIGSRWIPGGGIENWPKSRERLSRWASIYTRIVTGLPVHDTTAGFQAFRRRVLEELELDKIRSDGYSFQIETKFKVWRKGFWIKEIPIIFRDRELGESKINRKIVYEAFFMVWLLRIESLLGKI